MHSRYLGYSMGTKSMAFIPCVVGFAVFFVLVAAYGRINRDGDAIDGAGSGGGGGGGGSNACGGGDEIDDDSVANGGGDKGEGGGGAEAKNAPAAL